MIEKLRLPIAVTKSAKKILIGTNQFKHLSGSEVVTLEFADHFKAAGHEVLIFTNYTESVMLDMLRRRGFAFTTDPSRVRPLEFDLVYLQHQIAGLIDYSPSEFMVDATTFAFGRLSPNTLLEMGGWFHDNVLGDVVLANSYETAEALALHGNTLPVEVFHNACPAPFFTPAEKLPDRPRNILFVTNHANPDMLEAVRLLRMWGETVLHIGRSGERSEPVTPQTIANFDVVVTIGKTVQYALAGRRPVYVYDHFGGPGYLTAETFEKAAFFNFSGRCCGRKLDGAALAADILARFGVGCLFAHSIPEAALDRFRLDVHLDRLLARPPSSNRERLERMAENMQALRRERAISSQLRITFRWQERYKREQAADRQKIAEQERLLATYRK